MFKKEDCVWQKELLEIEFDLMRLLTSLIMVIVHIASIHSQNEKRRIDAHIHLYDINREGSYTFLEGQKKNGSEALLFTHLEAQFQEVAYSSAIEYAYVVEASRRREDNFWLSKIADTSKHILGFTANLNPLDTNFIADLDSLKTSSKFRGVRPRINGFDLSDDQVLNNLSELDKRNLVLELNGLNHVNLIASHYPNLPIIINHFGDIKLKNGTIPNWEYYHQFLTKIASHENVYIKISALFTLSGEIPAPIDLNYYRPLLDIALNAFGSDRVIFGSNWPLSDLRGNYKNIVKILEDYCRSRSDLSEDQLFFKNILKVYGLVDPTIPKFMELSNDTLRLKLDLTRGGAIAYISKSDVDRNIVNVHDEGRYIQQSYYGGKRADRRKEGQKSAWSPWSWNPIQVGDCYRNRAEILEYKQEGNTLYIKCIPMLWDMKNKPAEAIMEQWTTLRGNVITVKNKLSCQRTDSIYGEGISNNQELPAVYPISALNNLYTYFGNKPFTSESLDKPEVKNLRSGFWGRYQNDMVTENWMAFVNDNLWGIGVYTPICTNFLAGMAGDPGFESNDASTSYIAPVKKETFNKDSVYEYDYYLIIGDLEEIRENVYKLNNSIKAE